MGAHVELGRQLRVLGVADLGTVDPDVYGGGDGADGQEGGAVRGRPRHVHDPAVRADRVVVGARPRALVLDGRRIVLKDVVDVGVDGKAVALELPVAGHCDVAPARVVVLGLLELGRRPIRPARGPVEAPGSIERYVSHAALPVAGESDLTALSGEHCAVRRLFVYVEASWIRPLGECERHCMYALAALWITVWAHEETRHTMMCRRPVGHPSAPQT